MTWRGITGRLGEPQPRLLRRAFELAPLDGSGGVGNERWNSPVLRVYRANLPRFPRRKGGGSPARQAARFSRRASSRAAWSASFSPPVIFLGRLADHPMAALTTHKRTNPPGLARSADSPPASILVTPAPPELGLHARAHRHHFVDGEVLLGREQRVPGGVEFLSGLATHHGNSCTRSCSSARHKCRGRWLGCAEFLCGLVTLGGLVADSGFCIGVDA